LKSSLPGSDTATPTGGSSAALPVGFGLGPTSGRTQPDALRVNSVNMENAAVAHAVDVAISDASRNYSHATMGHLQGEISALRRLFNARKGDADIEDTGSKDETIRTAVTAAAATAALMSDRFRNGSCGSSILVESPTVARSPEQAMLQQQAQMHRLEATSPVRSGAPRVATESNLRFTGGGSSLVRPGRAANCEEGTFLGSRAASSEPKAVSAQLSDLVNGGTYLGGTSPVNRRPNPSALDALSTSFPQVKTMQSVASVQRSRGRVSPSLPGGLSVAENGNRSMAPTLWKSRVSCSTRSPSPQAAMSRSSSTSGQVYAHPERVHQLY